ncbi:MAG: hypothetical protein ABIQ18_22540 [Umezawaea sp.]
MRALRCSAANRGIYLGRAKHGEDCALDLRGREQVAEADALQDPDPNPVGDRIPA